MQRFLRIHEVAKTVGLSRSRIYDLIRRKEFPAPAPISDRAVAWTDTSIQKWIDERVAAAQQQQQPVE
jgi:prophage regulatory protein